MSAAQTPDADRNRSKIDSLKPAPRNGSKQASPPGEHRAALIRDELERELADLVVDVAGLDAADFDRETDLLDEAGLDSLTALRIVAAAELRWKLRVPVERLYDIRSVEQLATTLKSMPDEGGAESPEAVFKRLGG